MAWASERWPRYVKPPIEALWVGPLGLMLAPLWLFVRAMDWAGNSQARRAVVGAGVLVVLSVLAWFFDHHHLLQESE